MDHLPDAYRRLMDDGLIGASIQKHKERREEIDFQFWQVETVWPEAVNLEISRIGER